MRKCNMQDIQTRPPCREGTTEEDLRREADRSVLYGACLKLLRPQSRLKPQIAEAVAALIPSVQAFFDGDGSPRAQLARDYATACGAQMFLEAKAQEYRVRNRRELAERG
jgi:hypothetical protein